jgi:phosphohistidine phosphatase SixA
LVAIVVLEFVTTAPASAQKAVYFVRHAEKAGDDKNSLLTTAGTQRAEALARHLKDAGITAIYTSDAKRTQDTAAPIATALKVKPDVVNVGDAATIFKKVSTDHPNEVVLVVGHTNTVPDLIKVWGSPSLWRSRRASSTSFSCWSRPAPGRRAWRGSDIKGMVPELAAGWVTAEWCEVVVFACELSDPRAAPHVWSYCQESSGVDR